MDDTPLATINVYANRIGQRLPADRAMRREVARQLIAYGEALLAFEANPLHFVVDEPVE